MKVVAILKLLAVCGLWLASPLFAQTDESIFDQRHSDGAVYNDREAIILLLGPGSMQRGHPNPIGLPPSLVDFELTYVHESGLEANVSVIPGLTVGARYRTGSMLYGAIGGGLIISALGSGPGIYTAIGLSINRQSPFTFEVEVKQTVGLVASGGSLHVTMPYAVRLGAGYNF